MQTDLVHVRGSPLHFDQHMTLAKAFAESGWFPDIRAAAQALVKIQAGKELGLPPLMSMTVFQFIKGKLTLSANGIAAVLKRSGKYDYRVKVHDDQRCVLQFLAAGQAIGESAFTMDDARKAGLAGGDNWRKFPRNMLFARAISNGAKWHCPDVFGGPIYTPDEIGGEVDGDTGDAIVVSVRKAVIDPVQVAALETLIRRKGADVSRLLAHYRVGSIGDLNEEQHGEVIAQLNRRADVSIESSTGSVSVGQETASATED